MVSRRSLTVIGALAMGMAAVLGSGCAQAQGPEQEHPQLPAQASSQTDNQSLAHSPIAPAHRPASNPGQTTPKAAPGPKQADDAPERTPGENPPGGLAEERKQPPEQLPARGWPKAQKASEESGPISGKLSPAAKPSDSSEKPKPIYGLPLEYHFDLPEVPQRIQGPTPMPVVSKPALPGPLPQRE